MNIALNTYSFRNEWKGKEPHYNDQLIAVCRDLEINSIEFLDSHLNKDTFLEDVKKFQKAGISIFSLGPHVKLLVKPDEVKKQIADGTEWLTRAQAAGSKFVRFQVGDGPFSKLFQPMNDFGPEEWEDYNSQIKEAVDVSEAVITPLLNKAESLGVKMGIETHHSYSSNYVYMQQINERFPSQHLGWIFDIGNYENDIMRWKALDVIKKRTLYLHAKAYTFTAEGLEKNLDYPKACQILHDVGFTGNWSIEFEGKMSGLLGAMKTNELIKYSIAKAQGKAYQMKTKFPSEKDLLKKYTIK